MFTKNLFFLSALIILAVCCSPTVIDGGIAQNQSINIENIKQQDSGNAQLKKIEIIDRACARGMIHIEGNMLFGYPDFVEIVQDSTCIHWINKDFPARCAEFDPKMWEKEKKKLSRVHMNFCIDTYEWPNKVNEEPLVFIDWVHAAKECTSTGKRLCSEDEWTFSCEGEEGLPYPYGYIRDSSACNIDKSWIKVEEKNLGPAETTADELKKLWQGVPSGSLARCVSSFGVHDLTGNVDEWTTSTRASGFRSVLKGGYWSVVRNRCRPSTRAHNEGHRYYQQGFRCCSLPATLAK